MFGKPTTAAFAPITAMVAVSFGSYASSALTDGSTAWSKVFAVVLIAAMTVLNVLGSQAVARTQTVIVYVVIGILLLFAVVTLVNIDPGLLSFSGYPQFRHIVSSVALTFFAFLGFGVITFTAKDLADPAKQLPRAITIALGIATVIYVAVALGVFGTLTVDEVVSSGGTALAEAAKPVLGDAGYWLMTVTALFSTAGATNAGLYPAAGVCDEMVATGQFPPALGRRLGGRASSGLLVTAALISLVSLGRLDAWVAMVIIAREVAVTILRTIAAERGLVIAASWLGKAKTVLQIAAVIALIAANPAPLWVDVLVYLALVVTVLSGADYFFGLRKRIEEQRREPEVKPRATRAS